MNRRRGLVALGAGTLLSGWALGSRALLVIGTGVMLAWLSAALWRRLALRGLTVERRVSASRLVEGDPLVLEARLAGRRRVPSIATLHDTVGPVGDVALRLRGGHNGQARLPGAPRGVFRLGPARLVLEDPLGLERIEQDVGTGATVVVRPRVPVLTGLFTDGGVRSSGGRVNVPRPTGLEPHGVREYREGEPLRAVHWPSTARRGRLMIREVDDAARDDVAVVLDADAAGVVGEPGSSSLDELARATGAIVRAHAACGRRVALVVAAGTAKVVRLQALDGEWEVALDVLAAIEPAAGGDARGLLVGGAAARAHELVLVTALADDGRADLLTAAALAGRRRALVAVDGRTYGGGRPTPDSPALLRAAAAGVAVTRIRQGDDLAVALGAVVGTYGIANV
ncbi:MAG: DUF58 domain-containing protein [Gaiella sp.]